MNPLPFKIALRYFVSKKSHTAVSVISVISVCAVAVTAMAMICVLSVFNGFHTLVDSKLSRLEPVVKVSAMKGVINNADSVGNIIAKVDGVAIAEPVITENALVIYGNRQIPVTLKGVTSNYCSLTDMKELIKEGGEFVTSDSQGNFYSVLSIGAASMLQVNADYDKDLQLIAPKRIGAVNVANPSSAFRRVTTGISGVFEVKQGEYDINYVYTSIEASRMLYDYTSEATAIEVALKPGVEESKVMNDIAKHLGADYKVENRLMQHSESLKMINVEKWISLLLLTLILVVASFNVISTLSILIIEKDKSISTFRALGATIGMVEKIFVFEGWLISVSGAVIGLIIGCVLCVLQQQFGIISLGGDGSNLVVDVYPVALNALDVLAVFAIVAVVGFLSSIVTVRAMREYLR